MAKVTAGGFSRTDVVANMLDRVRFHDVAKAQFWAAELVVSGHAELVLSKLVAFMSAEVHAQNPRLPSKLRTLVRRAVAAAPDMSAAANVQEVRDAVAEAVMLLCLSTKKAWKPPKIAESDFEPAGFKSRILSSGSPYVTLRAQDPPELAVPLNELATHALEQQRQAADRFGLLTRRDCRACPQFWLAWILEMDKRASGRGSGHELAMRCAPRHLARYDAKHDADGVWAVWEVLLKLVDDVGTPAAQGQVRSLLALYAHGFAKGRKGERRSMLFHALSYVTAAHAPDRPDTVDRVAVLRTVASVNFVYRSVAAEVLAWEASSATLADPPEPSGPARLREPEHARPVFREFVLSGRTSDTLSSGLGQRSV